MTNKLITAATAALFSAATASALLLGAAQPACAMSFEGCTTADTTYVVAAPSGPQPKVWIVAEHDGAAFDALPGDTINVVMDGTDGMDHRCADMGGDMLDGSMVCWNVDF